MSGLIILLVVGLIYFLPTLVAYNKKRKNKLAILVVNTFLGWTFLGWIIALVWCVKEEN